MSCTAAVGSLTSATAEGKSSGRRRGRTHSEPPRAAWAAAAATPPSGFDRPHITNGRSVPTRGSAAPGDRHEIGLDIAEQQERGAVGDTEADRAERVLDGHLALIRPSEDAGKEAAELGLVLLAPSFRARTVITGPSPRSPRRA
jgi:hypothetical protein